LLIAIYARQLDYVLLIRDISTKISHNWPRTVTYLPS